MIRAVVVVPRAAAEGEPIADTVTLDHEGRHRRRIALRSDAGLEFLLDLARTTALEDGDALRLEDGRLIQIKAAPQPLLEIRAENPLRLLRMAWHIGNRHAPAEMTAEAIYVEDDHVLSELARAQGCTATRVERPFRPERGAYEETGGHHDHSPGAHRHGHAGHGHRGHEHDD